MLDLNYIFNWRLCCYRSKWTNKYCSISNKRTLTTKLKRFLRKSAQFSEAKMKKQDNPALDSVLNIKLAGGDYPPFK
jgi:hypothetical protein